MEKTNEIFIKSACGTEGILIGRWKEEKLYYLAFYNYGHINPKPSFWQRLKYACYHIRTGKKCGDEVMLHKDEKKKLTQFLVDN